MAKEASLEGLSFSDKIGMPKKEFSEFVIRGTGSVIFFILSALSIAAVIGNNYYWNKCSEKYDWR